MRGEIGTQHRREGGGGNEIHWIKDLRADNLSVL